MAKYLLKCKICGDHFESYEEYVGHVFSRLIAQNLKPEILKEE